MSDQPNYADVRKAQSFFGSAIEHCMKGELKSLQSLVETFRRDNLQYNVSDIFESFQSEGKTFLHVAASSGNLNIFEYILGECNAKELVINATDVNGFTPLLNATISESDEIIKKILSLNANINAQNNDGAAAIHFAAADGNIPRMKLLIEKKADTKLMSTAGNALHWAAGKGRVDAIKLLIENHIDIDAVSPTGLPAVFMAAVSKSDDSVEVLVDAGANVGFVVTGNLTVLHICAENGLVKSVEAILKTPTGPKCCLVQTTEEYYPIDLAAMSSEREIVEILLPYSGSGIKPSTDVDEIIAHGQIQLKQWMESNEATKSSSSSSSSVNGSQQQQDTNNRTNIGYNTEHHMEAIMNLFKSLRPVESEESKLKAEEYKSLGNQKYKDENYTEAVTYYDESIKLNGMNATVWSNRSACHLALGNAEAALMDAEICRRLDPKWPKGCYRLASARLALHQYEDAAVAAFEGCKLDEGNKDLKLLLQKAVQLGKEDHERKMKQIKEEEEKNANKNNGNTKQVSHVKSDLSS